MMKFNEQLFTRGFNDGYILARYEPNLLTLVIGKINQANDYFSGLISGQKEYELESQINDLSKLRQSKNQERDLDR